MNRPKTTLTEGLIITKDNKRPKTTLAEGLIITIYLKLPSQKGLL